MFTWLKNLFGSKPAESAAEAPYKVETPAVDLSDIGIAQRPASEVPVEVPVVATKPAPAKKAPAKKPAAKKAAPKKEAAPKKATTGAKRGRKPKNG